MDASALLAWYRRERRRMPWREEVSPYRTLVSEIMLQQTRVETVIPYFERFLTVFPDVEALARAPLDDVLARWSGLGYYRRARSLHAAAQAIVARGGFPDTVDGLRALPGIGPYTAGAIASIALGVDAALVDGNVERVLCRFHAWEEDPKRISRRIWARAEELLPRGEAGDFNQALMELGATICTPTSPRCLLCPARSGCAGMGAPERYPARAPKKAVPSGRAGVVLFRRGEAILVARRPEGGLLGGMWELPGAAFGNDVAEGDRDAVLAAVVAERLGCTVQETLARGAYEHVFTHLRLTTHVHLGVLDGEPSARAHYTDVRWVAPDALGDLAVSTWTKKALRVAGLGGCR